MPCLEAFLALLLRAGSSAARGELDDSLAVKQLFLMVAVGYYLQRS